MYAFPLEEVAMSALRSTCAHVAVVAALLAALIAPAPTMAQSIIIDDFSTNQAALTLTYPPAGTSASSSASGSGILGGERDMQINLTGGVIAGNTESAVVSSGFFSYSQDATIAGNSLLQWDGTDGSATLNPTGLGGVDLTAGGTQDAFLLNVFFDDLPVNSVITVYSDAGNASSFTLALPGLLFSSTNFAIPYSSFATTLGTGADFTNVGAITLSVGSTTTAPDLVIDFFQTTSLVNATKTVALHTDVNGNGLADPGDTLRYTVIITNPTDAGGAAETGVVFTNPTPANTTLTTGSVTTTQGTVTTGNIAGDNSVAVNVGTLVDGGTATVTFDVVINNSLPAGVTQITCQGTVTAPSLPTGVLTDDPTQPGPMDPTVIPVSAAPAVTALKTVVLAVDVNGNGQANAGDTLKYTIVINNTGNQDASGVMYTNAAPANTALVVGSVTTTQGTVTTGNTAGNTSVLVNVGTIPGGGSVTIMFQVKINDPLPAGVTQITCQGTVTGTNIPSTPTDNPNTGTPGDPTTIPVALPPAPVPTLNEWGLLILLGSLMACALFTLRRQRRQGRRAAL
jgi:uncharacterized repeat protein (TIGR01451 family)